MERLLPPAFDVIIKSKLCTKDSVHKYENNCNLSFSLFHFNSYERIINRLIRASNFSVPTFYDTETALIPKSIFMMVLDLTAIQSYL